LTRPKDFLAVLTPGAGKTYLSAVLSRGALDGGYVQHVHVVVPTTALKLQWGMDFADVGLRLETQYRTGAHLSRDMHGTIVTYAQVAERPRAFVNLYRNSLGIFDEIHHAGDDSSWGSALRVASDLCAHRLQLSGTPFRSNRERIAHLRYDSRGYVIADYLYGYAEAVRAKIVRPIVAYPSSATVKWKGADGKIRESDLETHAGKQHEAERLRAILSYPSWIAELITRANAILTSLRRRDEDAGGLVVCMTANHARTVADIMRRTLGIDPVVVLSEDDDADRRLNTFRNSTSPWIIAVRKVSEGVDIRRLRVLAYLTNARTELSFRQIVGRVVRTRDEDNSPGYVFYPADPTLDELMRELRREITGEADAPVGAAIPLLEPDETPLEDQLEDELARELEVLSATFIDLDPYHAITATVNPNDLFAPKVEIRKDDIAVAEHAAAQTVLQKGQLRKIATGVARDVAHTFGLEIHDVYAHFAKLRGPIERADEPELQRRINTMRGWLTKGSHPVRRKHRPTKAKAE
jgi:superfamily II DNA or RNA helicase